MGPIIPIVLTLTDPLGRQEAGRPELERVGPQGRVSGDAPHVHQQLQALGDVEPGDLAVVGGHAGQRQRRQRVQSEGLPDDGVQQGEPREVALQDEPAAAHHGVRFFLGPLQDLRVADQLRQRPLHCD